MGNNYTLPQQSIVNHPRFGRSSLVNFNQHLMTQIGISKGQILSEWEMQLSALKNNHFINKQNLLLPEIYEISSSAVCGNDVILRLLYPAYPYIFKDEIQNRKLTSNFFQESQLWYLMFTLVSVATQHHEVCNVKVGDIRPQNIFFNQQGKIKIATKISWPGQKDNYQKVVMDHIQTYIAPEEVQSTSLRSIYLTSSKQIHKSQTFSIGLTLLHTALLEDMNKLYLPPGHFNHQFFEMKLEKLKSLSYIKINQQNQKQYYAYSLQLKEIILRLCQYNPKHRLDLNDLLQFLLPYENDIIQLKEFEPSGIPIRKSLYQLSQKRPKMKSFKPQQNKPNSKGEVQQNKPMQKAVSQQQPSTRLNNLTKKVVSYQQPFAKLQNLTTKIFSQQQPSARLSHLQVKIEKNFKQSHQSESPIKRFEYTRQNIQSQKKHHSKQSSGRVSVEKKQNNQISTNPFLLQLNKLQSNRNIYLNNRPQVFTNASNRPSKQKYVQDQKKITQYTPPKITDFNIPVQKNKLQIHFQNQPKKTISKNVTVIPTNKTYVERRSISPSISHKNITFTYANCENIISKNEQQKLHNNAYFPKNIAKSQKADSKYASPYKMTIQQLSQQSELQKSHRTPIKNLAGSQQYRNWANNDSSLKLLKKIDQQLSYSKRYYH